MNTSKKPDLRRRRFPRIKAPVFYRPVSVFGISRQAFNISLGGVRVYSNKPFKEGDFLEIELALPSKKLISAITRVVWIKALPPGSSALYDVGLEFINLPDSALRQLKSVLDKAASEE